ncbi:hypothetical protein GM418_08615 [Maribellus comscasis]|uniref:Uncharacterized protein n=1 Tax=Maribellus comscasis TaxID=2681766 RepID=A0A6I6JLL6_9BACT|nr:hypothetical protein [Maribellus comscasis]QGY43716.1 hypothetical protein GM418_08615 [Maribellus comscasis]
MASVKNLKKDIDLIMSLVISDCFLVLEENSKVDNEKILDIVRDVIIKHREFKIRVNHPDGKDNPKMVKQYYKKIVEDLLSEADKALEKLSAEVKKVA